MSRSCLWGVTVSANPGSVSIEGGGPKTVEPRSQVVEAGRVEPVHIARPHLFVGHQPAAPKDLKMLRDRWTAHWNLRSQLDN
jgi:hypothetical protein